MIQTMLRHWEYYDMTDTYSLLYEKSSNGEKFNRLYDTITSENNILLAYRTIKSNKGSQTAGTDSFTISHYKKLTKEEFITAVRNELNDYKPKAVKRTLIPKSNGQMRPLGIPTMFDRLIQQMFKQVLEPICEAKFYKHSYGFRPLRNAHHAIARANMLANISGYHHCVDIDIKGFFDEVCHSRLIKQLWNIGIQDRKVLAIISKMLKAPIKGIGIPTKGTPQGGILSPLLANVVLNDLDQWVAGQFENFNIDIPESSINPRSYKYKALKQTALKPGFIVRYADDFKIFTKSRSLAIRWFHAVKGYLKDRLKLNISEEKSGIINLKKKSTEFLGFTLKLQKKASKFVIKSNIREKKLKQIREQAVNRIKDISKNPNRNNCNNFNAFVIGIHNYFSIATHIYKDLDKLSYSLQTLMHNRLKGTFKFAKPTITTPLYKSRFGHLNRKVWSWNNIALFPIVAQKHRIPRNFTQTLTPYTIQGRCEIHKGLNPDVLNEVYKLNNFNNPKETIEYQDNRISRYSMKNGKCEISGVFLNAEDVHCHHVIPRILGGTDDFSNLRIIHKDIHKLVHAKNSDSMFPVIEEFKLNAKQIAKVNTLRKHCKLDKITI